MIYLHLILLFAVLGIMNASFLLWQHLRLRSFKKKMICPVGFYCTDVVESKYGTTFGVKNEIWGLLYYIVLIAVAVGALYGMRQMVIDVKILLILLGIAGLFASIYFLYLQAIILKKYCFWCLIAIVINIVLFVLEILYFFY